MPKISFAVSKNVDLCAKNLDFCNEKFLISIKKNHKSSLGKCTQTMRNFSFASNFNCVQISCALYENKGFRVLVAQR